MAECARCSTDLPSAAHYCSFCGQPVSEDGLFNYLVGIKDFSDGELDTLVKQLAQEEQSLSRHRRLLHGAIDLVRAEKVRRLRDGRSLWAEGE